MADDEAELRAGIIEFFRSMGLAESFNQQGCGDEGFVTFVDMVINANAGGLKEMFRSFHAEHGRYPKISELPPGFNHVLALHPKVMRACVRSLSAFQVDLAACN